MVSSIIFQLEFSCYLLLLLVGSLCIVVISIYIFISKVLLLFPNWLQVITIGNEGQTEMAVHATLSAYNTTAEPWTIYVERLNQYFIANDVEDSSKKRAILLAACSSKTFQFICSLTEEDPTSKPYYNVVQLITDYYDLKPSVIVQCYKFNSRVRGTNETISTYVAALRQLAEHCNYRNTLSEMLHDHLVCGINHPANQKTLLAEKDLTLDNALEIA